MPSTARYYWGRAEQNATDFGAWMTPFRREFAVDAVLKGITDIWRFTIAYGDKIEQLAINLGWCEWWNPVCSGIRGMYRLLREPFLNPRADPDNIKWPFIGIWFGYSLIVNGH